LKMWRNDAHVRFKISW